MKKILLPFIALLFLFGCSEEDTEETDENNFQPRIVRLENSLNEIGPKSIYIPDENSQITSYFKFDNQSTLGRLTHLVGEDNSDLATIISFDENGIINTIYQQNSLTGDVSNQIFLTIENEILYYGTESETFQNTETSSIENFGFIDNSEDDIMISNVLDLNRNILEHIKFITENNTEGNSRFAIPAFPVMLATLVIIGGIIYYALENPEQSTVLDCITSTDPCSNNRNSPSNLNNCSPLFNQFLCSNIESLPDTLGESTEIEVDLCNEQICLVSNFQGLWTGTYTGGDSGTWSININEYGLVSGTAYSTVFVQSFSINGNASFNGQLTATLGNVSTGSTFTGFLNGDSNANGNWQNPILNISGTWSGSRN